MRKLTEQFNIQCFIPIDVPIFYGKTCRTFNQKHLSGRRAAIFNYLNVNLNSHLRYLIIELFAVILLLQKKQACFD
jgi:hypothetical protein